MALSRFAPKRRVLPTRQLTQNEEENYDYSGGLNTYFANEVLKTNESPYINNVRITSLGTTSKAKGPGAYSVPAGETNDSSVTSTTGAADQTITNIVRKAWKYTAVSTGRLSRVDLNIKTTNGTGPIIIEVYTNVAGAPSALLATSSIPQSSVTSSYAYLTARFIEAPQVTAASVYWIVAYVQSNGTNSYLWSSTTSSSQSITSADSGVTWASTAYTLNAKAFVSTDGGLLGGIRFYKQDGTKYQVIAYKEAAGTTALAQVNDSTGVLTTVKTGLSSSATDYRFAVANDILYYVNGFDAPRQWDGTTEAAATGMTAIYSNIILHKNRLFLMQANNTRIDFTDAGTFTNIDATSFLYIPSPKSADPLSGWAVIQDNLYIATRKTKYVLQGADLTSFVLRVSTALQGVVNQDCFIVYQNYIYLLNETGVYQFNGATDKLISLHVTPDIKAIADYNKCCMVVYDNKLRLYYPSTGSGVNNTMLLCDLVYNESWYRDTNAYIRKAFLWRSGQDNGQLIEGSSVVGAIYKGEQGYNNLGKAIRMEIRSNYKTFGHPGVKKEIRRFYVKFGGQDSAYNADCQYDFDFAGSPTSNLISLLAAGSTWGGGGTWGSGLTWGKSSLISPTSVNIPGQHNYTQLRFVCDGVDTPCDFLGYSLYYFVQNPQ